MKPKSLGDYLFDAYIFITSGISLIWIASVIVLILFTLVTKFIPAWATAVAQWGADTCTAFAEHDWKYTDAVLYGGIAILLVFRYRNPFR